jgi:hypothetical protein
VLEAVETVEARRAGRQGAAWRTVKRSITCLKCYADRNRQTSDEMIDVYVSLMMYWRALWCIWNASQKIHPCERKRARQTKCARNVGMNIKLTRQVALASPTFGFPQ